jgi:hypothetical protein
MMIEEWRSGGRLGMMFDEDEAERETENEDDRNRNDRIFP